MKKQYKENHPASLIRAEIERLSRAVEYQHADMVHHSLVKQRQVVSIEEFGRHIGPAYRHSISQGIVLPTENAVRSRRNSSLIRIFHCRRYGLTTKKIPGADGIHYRHSEETLANEAEYWREQGMLPHEQGAVLEPGPVNAG
ncbi:MAG: hypothetical protein CMI30_13090 [Opitutae bacterium]|nr:hypothetical protein [Opitutae bacterium]|tara:strand:- start:2504 stop:2929 length:426 start_codon:yes stop_codon:yes gene_type:complete